MTQENYDDTQIEPIIPIDIEKACSLISYGGEMEKQTNDFEQRDSQIELLGAIAKSFNDNLIGVFEAGTGVGKSFAYLIPSLIWCKQNKERIIISTGTINLQQQLFEKDIPFAQKLTNTKIKTVLLKGRQNYVCIRRFTDLLHEVDLFTEEKDELNQLKEWISISKTGSKSDLTFQVQESIWQRINSESDACMGQRCPYKETCFVMKIRKEANTAQLLIVNHHLLFADIEMRLTAGFDDIAVLPPYKRIVFDEAHGIENAATSFFSESLTKFRIQKQLRLLYRSRKGNNAGLIFSIETISNAPSCLGELVSQIALLDTHIVELEENAKKLLNGTYSWRLNDKTKVRASDLFYSLQLVSTDLSQIIHLVRSSIEQISEDDKEINFVWETKQVLRRLEECASLATNFTRWEEMPDKVFWIEGGKIIHFNQTPLKISSFMNKGIFEPLETVISTSATLCINNSFSYWFSKNGINFADKNRIVSGVYSSPFPYKKNVLLTIPTDAPLPDNEYFQSYIENTIPLLIRAASGRTLVLFTSYETLRASYEAAFSTLQNDEFVLLKQGDDDRFKLLEKFKSDISSVLFATYSFWEGVDVPGESLSQVIIVKLPFGVPSDPVFAARCEDIERVGGNSFMDLSVPEAVIKFRQGFGRLLRKNTDMGVVCILDLRLLQKRYGEIFLRSLPETKTSFETTKDILVKIERFLN